VISDRYVGYHWLDVLQQQLCWAHWIRSLIALSERPGAPGRLGKKLLESAREAIHIHHAYLEHEHDLDWLREQLAPLRASIQALLEQGTRGHEQKTANYCAGLLEEYDALWAFCDVQDLQIPMDNNPRREPSATRSFSDACRAAPSPITAAVGSSGSSRSARRCASKTAPCSTT
jgi:transposase